MDWEQDALRGRWGSCTILVVDHDAAVRAAAVSIWSASATSSARPRTPSPCSSASMPSPGNSRSRGRAADRRAAFSFWELHETYGDDLPVILVSAEHGPLDHVAGLLLGADDYLSKPFDQGEALCTRPQVAESLGRSVERKRKRVSGRGGRPKPPSARSSRCSQRASASRTSHGPWS